MPTVELYQLGARVITLVVLAGTLWGAWRGARAPLETGEA